MLPQYLALMCIVVSLLFYTLDENAAVAAWLLSAAAGFVYVARSLERGQGWALWLVTALVLALTVAGVGAFFAEEAPALERAQFAAGAALILTPCWTLVTLGWKARRRADPSLFASATPPGEWARLPREHRSPRTMALFALAILIYAAGLIPAALAAIAVGGHLWITAIVYAPIAALAGRTWNRGRRHAALRVQEIRRLDTRSPVLLLRSFGDDSLPLEKRYHFFWFLFTARNTLTLEAFVVDHLWRLGPVLAIGDPAERLSPLGAAREYIADERWRARIREYLQESAFVVCVLGATPGVVWEYQQLDTLAYDDPLLVVFPPRPADELQRRWALFQSTFRRTRGIDLQWEPFIGVPLLAYLSKDGATFFYCHYRHETAYAAAFNRLFGAMAVAPDGLPSPSTIPSQTSSSGPH